MTTLLRTLLLVVLALAVAAPAAAQKKGARAARADKGEKTRFYNFDDMVVDGEFRKPSVLLTTAREQSRFERLLRLRKSFLPEMLKTARFPELKNPAR